MQFRIFRFSTCLLSAMDIRPQDNGALDIVMSFHNDFIPDNSHNLLLTLHSFMISWKGKYRMIFRIVSVGRSIRSVGLCSPCLVDVVGI